MKKTQDFTKVRNEVFSNAVIMKDSEMKSIIGSGNSQVRFIPDEYLQAKILKDGR